MTHEIVLTKLAMRNFRGAKEQVTEFYPTVTNIAGRNGLGKSRHADAFFWCLTGKDTLDRKDYEIKTRTPNGDTLRKADASVEVTLSINGKDTRFKRVLVEKWETPKGQIEEVYKGNKTECFIDDVPVSVNDYTNRVAAIIPTETLKLVTNPYYFAEIMDWRKRREVLASMGAVTLQEAAADDSDLLGVIEDMNGKSEDDYKKMLVAQIATLKSKPSENDIRIRQIQEDMPAQEDWDALQKELDELEAELDTLQLQYNNLGESNGQFVAKKYTLEGEIRKLEADKAEIVAAVKRKVDSLNAERQEEYRIAFTKKKECEITIDAFAKNIEGNNSSIAKAEQAIAAAADEKAKLAEQYEQLKSGEGECPLCGGVMTDECAGKLLPDVIAKINNLNNIIDHTRKVADGLQDSNAGLQRQIDEAKAILAEMGELTQPTLAAYNLENNAEVQSINAEIKRAETALNEFVEGVDNTDYKEMAAKIESKKQERNALLSRLAAKSRIDELNERIEQIESETQSVVAERAALERKLYSLMQLQVRKADLLQERVNGKFSLVEFSLFEFTIEGNPVEICNPTINGVPYASANSAARLNAGLDIINTLSRHYGYTAPIWIDNAESTLGIFATDAQQIRLIVSDSEQLNIKGF